MFWGNWKMSMPSAKKGRRSEKNDSKADRFTWAGSASTCPKSGFTVADRVRFDVTPYFTSAPKLPRPVFPVRKGFPGSATRISALPTE
ncbi:MAG: hypothetical protein EXR93_08410 [Gemmatimonadetes bacterium]|nr:hypothetical protein [Gemmatimonadota bacterium]